MADSRRGLSISSYAVIMVVLVVVAFVAYGLFTYREFQRVHADVEATAHAAAREEHHAMPRRAKRIALVALAASYTFTAWVFGPLSWTAVLAGVCMAGVALYIAHLPVLGKGARHTANA